MPSPPRPRRALSARGGAVRSDGDPRARRLLTEALAIPPEADSRELTHGFHSYPARFHPLLCRRIFAEHAQAGTVLLDPFVGSGTSLVEAALRGARGRGVDANPLAIALATLKATPWTEHARNLLLDRSLEVAARSLERVKKRTRSRSFGHQYDDPKHYETHVFRELVGLREELDGEVEPFRNALLLVLSSILVKVSKQKADTSAHTVERAVGKGLPTRLFQRKADELVRQLAAFAAAVPLKASAPDVRLGDARKLDHVPAASVDLILTSPPYLGTYDYTEHHARRFGWLGLDATQFDATEIGARRRTAPDAPAGALARWQKDVDAFVAEFARVLKPGGLAFVAIGDSCIGTQVVPGDVAIRRAAERARMRLVANAAEERDNFYARANSPLREEHLILLTV
jgi:DNA modification methylase